MKFKYYKLWFVKYINVKNVSKTFSKDVFVKNICADEHYAWFENIVYIEEASLTVQNWSCEPWENVGVKLKAKLVRFVELIVFKYWTSFLVLIGGSSLYGQKKNLCLFVCCHLLSFTKKGGENCMCFCVCFIL